MKKKVLSLAALALFMASNLNANQENWECDVYAQNVYDHFITFTSQSAAYELSEIAYEECTNGNCEGFGSHCLSQ